MCTWFRQFSYELLHSLLHLGSGPDCPRRLKTSRVALPTCAFGLAWARLSCTNSRTVYLHPGSAYGMCAPCPWLGAPFVWLACAVCSTPFVSKPCPHLRRKPPPLIGIVDQIRVFLSFSNISGTVLISIVCERAWFCYFVSSETKLAEVAECSYTFPRCFNTAAALVTGPPWKLSGVFPFHRQMSSPRFEPKIDSIFCGIATDSHKCVEVPKMLFPSVTTCLQPPEEDVFDYSAKLRTRSAIRLPPLLAAPACQRTVDAKHLHGDLVDMFSPNTMGSGTCNTRGIANLLLPMCSKTDLPNCIGKWSQIKRNPS